MSRSWNVFILVTFFRNGEDCAANHYLGHFFFGTPITEEIKSKVAKIKEEYFGNGNDINDLEVLQNLTNSFTDSGFFYGTDKMARYIIIEIEVELLKNPAVICPVTKFRPEMFRKTKDK